MCVLKMAGFRDDFFADWWAWHQETGGRVAKGKG